MYEILFQKQNHNKKLQILPSSSTTTAGFSSSLSLSTSPPFELPNDWVTELRPRKCDGRFDKYYYEPGTGRQFRSLSSIQKYLSGDIDGLPKRHKPRYGQIMAIDQCSYKGNPSFKLPNGWVVEEKLRNNVNYTGTVDRYYYEPGTGRQFRSLSSVQRYLSGDISGLPKPRNGENMSIVPCSFKRNPSFRLPKGWVVKKKERDNINYAGQVDRTYIEPGTGKKFRSLLSVERYIAEGNLHAATPRPHQLYLTDGKQYTTLAEESILGYHSPSSSFGCEKKQKKSSGNKVEASIVDLRRPPTNVKWVLSPVGSIWKPFIKDTLVPESLKRNWSQAFEYTLNYGC